MRRNAFGVDRCLLVFSVIFWLVRFLIGDYAFAAGDITGSWSWVSGQTIVFKSDRSFEVLFGDQKINDGKWECTNPSDGTFVLRHRQGGWVDTVKLSTDGNTLSGTSNTGHFIRGTRIIQDYGLSQEAEIPRSIGPVHWCLACPRAPERRLDIGFTVPSGVTTILVQIRGGADDAGGDLAVEVLISDPSGKVLLSERARSHSWEDFRCSPSQAGQYFVTLRDTDTDTGGNEPGNGGSLKIILQ